MTELDVARILATAAHHRQYDKGDQPYVGHPARIAAALAAAGWDEAHQTVGWLHDVVEDTPVTLQDLATLGFGDAIIAAVDAMTQRKKEKAPDYYQRVLADPLARVVKHFDVADNSSPERMAALAPETQERLTAKYVRAREWLGELPAPGKK